MTDHPSDVDAALDAERLCALAEAARARDAGDLRGGSAAAERAWVGARAAGHARAAAEAGALHAWHLWRQGRSDEAIALAQQLLPSVDAHSPPEVAVDLRNTLTMAVCEQGRPAEALGEAVTALRLASELGRPGPLSWATNRLGVVFDMLGLGERAAELLQQAVELADVGGTLEMRLSARFNLIVILAHRAEELRLEGREETAQGIARQALEQIEQALASGSAPPHFVMNCEHARTTAYMFLGELEPMRAAIERFETLAQQLGLSHFVAMGAALRAQWLEASGQAEAACELLDNTPALAMLETEEAAFLWLVRARSRAYRSAGRLPQALDAIEKLVTLELRAAHRRLREQARALLRDAEIEELRLQSRHWQRELAQARAQAAQATRAAQSDALTGLANRRALDEHLAAWLGGTQASAGAVAILDVDEFKQINDRFGHDAGDHVLRELAGLLAGALEAPALPDAVGNTLLAARNGGDEFVLVLPGANAALAAQRLEALRQRVAAHPWGAQVAERAITVTIGFAVAMPGDTPHSLLRRADKAMYAAKRAGRNRVAT